MGGSASSSCSAWPACEPGGEEAELEQLCSFVICRLTPQQDTDPRREPPSPLLVSRGWAGRATQGGGACAELSNAPLVRCERCVRVSPPLSCTYLPIQN